MAFKDYRNPSKNSIPHEFDIDRFAYDVFAYMLRICGLPEEKIPTSNLKENIYIKDDFVTNIGLSALPISLYMRDEWRNAFEEIFEKVYKNFEVQEFLESSIYLPLANEFEDNDILSKIQFSLALYNEYTLFLNFKGIEIPGSLPKFWSRLFKKLVEQSDFDGTLESSMTMNPDVSESWIRLFIRKFAIPYASSNDVSIRFSIYTLKLHSGNDTLSTDTSEGVANVVPEESEFQPYDNSDKDTETSLPKGTNSEFNSIAGRCSPCSDPCDQLQIPESNALVETSQYGRYTNGLTFVLQQCLGRRKRSRSQKLEVEDAFGKINLGIENISPESRDPKRRRKTSGMNRRE